MFEPDSRIVAAACQPILHYVLAEDHGWSFNLFCQGELVSGYCCHWNEDLTIEDSDYSRVSLQQWIPAVNPTLLDEFEKVMYPKVFGELFESEPSKVLAQALGVEHYEWLSYNYIIYDLAEDPDGHPELTEVA